MDGRPNRRNIRLAAFSNFLTALCERGSRRYQNTPGTLSLNGNRKCNIFHNILNGGL